jgi:hypothetical protein
MEQQKQKKQKAGEPRFILKRSAQENPVQPAS